MAGVLGVDTDLVGTTGNRTAFDQGRLGELTHDPKTGFRRLAIGTDPHDPLARLQLIFAQRRIHHPDMWLPLATYQRQILFAHGLDPQLFVQTAQGTALLGDQEHTWGIAIETMHQFEETGFWAQGAQPFNHAETEAAAAMHSHTGRLVQYDHGIVFKQDLTLEALDNPKIGRGQLIFFGHTYGGHPHFVARAEFVLRFDALFVYPHFAFAKDAIDQALGDAL